MSDAEVHRLMILIMEKKRNLKRKKYRDLLRLSETLSLPEMIDHEDDQELQNGRKKIIAKKANQKVAKKTDVGENRAHPRLRHPAPQAHHRHLLLHQMDLSPLEKPVSRIRKRPEENQRKRAALPSESRLRIKNGTTAGIDLPDEEMIAESDDLIMTDEIVTKIVTETTVMKKDPRVVDNQYVCCHQNLVELIFPYEDKVLFRCNFRCPVI